MKIKFLKDFMATQSDDFRDLHSILIKRGDIVDVDGCKYNDSYFDMPKEQAQWLIDNGFAEEVKESGWWKPKEGEPYYSINSGGGAEYAKYEGGLFDKFKVSVGNCFKTYFAADRYRDYLRAIATVRQDEGVLTPEQIKELEGKAGDVYCVPYTSEQNEELLRSCTIDFGATWAPVGSILFDTEEHADASRKKHQEEWQTILNYDWSRE